MAADQQTWSTLWTSGVFDLRGHIGNLRLADVALTAFGFAMELVKRLVL